MPEDPHPAMVLNHRWTNYAVLQLRLFPEGQLVGRSSTYVQPRFDDPRDVRVLEQVQLEARVGSIFALGADLLVQFDSRPPRQVESLDLTLGSYVRLRFP